jgi:hypothetical protein
MFWNFYVGFIIIGRLVEDHASATHGWRQWAHTYVRGNQRRHRIFKNQRVDFKKLVIVLIVVRNFKLLI